MKKIRDLLGLIDRIQEEDFLSLRMFLLSFYFVTEKKTFAEYVSFQICSFTNMLPCEAIKIRMQSF